MDILPLLKQYLQVLYLHSFLVTLFLVSLLFLFIHIKTNGKAKLPPSPPKFPIIGNLHQLGTHPHRSLRALSEKYGPMMLMHLGQSPTLVLSSADIAKECLKTHDIAFSGRHQTTAADILFYGCKDVGFSPFGEYWKQARKFCSLELLSLKRVQNFQFVRDEEVEIMVDRIRKACLSGASVNISQMLMATSNNIVSKSVLGQSFSEEDGRSRFGEMTRKVMVHLMAFCVADFFPSLRWIDVLSGFINRVTATFRDFDSFFDQLIEERKSKATKKRDGESDMKDFVDILLQLPKDDMQDFDFTQDNMKAILLDMLVGGSDSTSTGLEWLMAELMRNSQVMKKVQEEVRGVVGKKQKIDMNDIKQMEYLKCVIKENLRLHPPVPLLVPRETTSSIDMRGYHIPANTKVIVNAWAIQRDPKLWDKAEEFIPERFENNPVDFKGQDFQFIPFGSGRRGCPGITFGLANTEFIIANLLYWFDWKLSGDGGLVPEEVDMSEGCGLAVSRKVPLHLSPVLYHL
ncbi:hypothetical protein UlMin_020245 [Ulmus minor]